MNVYAHSQDFVDLSRIRICEFAAEGLFDGPRGPAFGLTLAILPFLPFLPFLPAPSWPLPLPLLQLLLLLLCETEFVEHAFCAMRSVVSAGDL